MIAIRTLQSVIELLRNGDFIHDKQDLPENIRCKLFKVTYAGKIYSWAEDSAKPEFGDLEEQERYTLPFLMGLLKKYESIPAVSKIMQVLPASFGISEEEMQSKAFLYISGATLIDAESTITLAIRLLGHINRREMIEFNYASVEKLDGLTLHAVAPLHIRFYNELYYLTAFDPEKKELRNFRIDQILNYRVDTWRDDENNILYFDPDTLETEFRIASRFDHILGVWVHKLTDPIYKIEIKFKGWAAGYMQKLQFHKSQKIESINKGKNEVVISLTLRLDPESWSGQPYHERSPELAGFINRFGDKAEILSARAV